MDEFWALPAESAPALLHALRARLLVSGTPPAVPTAGADGQPYALHDGIAVIGVRGVLTRRCERGLYGERLTQGQDEILQAMTAAQADPSVRALFFSIDSPGGVVAGTKELADAVAASPKPAGAYADGQATSAAFWLASATGRVYAPATALLGSVGVISEAVSLCGYLKRQGIDVQVLSAGKWKAAGHRAQPLDDERRAYLQRHVDALHELFRADVARHLGIAQSPAWTEAQVLLAPAARELGLIRAVVRDRDHALHLFTKEVGMEDRHQESGPLTRQALEASAPELLRALIDEGRAQGLDQGRMEARQESGAARADGVDAALAAMGVCCDAATVARVRDFMARAEALGLSAAQVRGIAGLLPAAQPTPQSGENAPSASRQAILEALHQAQPAPLPHGGAAPSASRGKSPLVADAERLAAAHQAAYPIHEEARA